MSKELEIAKKYGITRFKPQKYRYKMRSKQIRVGLGVAEDYPYDWFLGGVDSCQGDSGGPLWRNIEVKCKMCDIKVIIGSRMGKFSVWIGKSLIELRPNVKFSKIYSGIFCWNFLFLESNDGICI